MLEIVTKPMSEHKAGPIELAWDTFKKQLHDSVAVGALVRILNGVELRAQGKRGVEIVEVTDRDLADALRLKRLAEATINHLLYPEIVESAVDEAAHVICEGANAEYERFEHQSPKMQAHYRALAQSAINAYRMKLEGLS